MAAREIISFSRLSHFCGCANLPAWTTEKSANGVQSKMHDKTASMRKLTRKARKMFCAIIQRLEVRPVRRRLKSAIEILIEPIPIQ